jgi:transcriptional regulator with XRE-family HTH domain
VARYPANPIVCGRKFCAGCGRWRLIVDFSTRSSSRDVLQLQGRCHPCQAAYLREWRANLEPVVKEKIRQEDRARAKRVHRRRTSEERAAEAAQQRAYRERNRERLLAAQRQKHAELMKDPKYAEEYRGNRRMNYRLRAEREGRNVRELRKETYANGNGKAPLKGRRRFPSKPIADLISEWLGELGGAQLNNAAYNDKAGAVFGAGFIQLAELTGIPDRTLRAYVAGERPTVQYATLDAICAALDTPIASLYPEAR